MARNPYNSKRVNIPAAAEQIKNDYQAAKASRFKRERTGVALAGAAADYHYRSEADYLRIMEYARDMDRNDAIVGQMVDRAVHNTIQGGLMPRPNTGDKALDDDLIARFMDWASDPLQSDVSGQFTFWEFQQKALRHVHIDGDIFFLPLNDGQLQPVEAHRCRTAKNTQRNVVHGIMLDDRRKPVQYWFTKDEIDPFQVVQRVGDIEQFPAFDSEGRPNVYHVKNPKRVTQTRGVTALAPIFDESGIFEDIQFAKLVQQQVVSCIAFIRNRDEDYAGNTDPQMGARETDLMSDGVKRLIEELSPGMELESEPGEKIEGFSPQVPNSEYFQHARMTLQLIGINLGMPLVLLLMDGSETNFTGWRGAVDQARFGFRENQRLIRNHFCRPTWNWKVAQFVADDRALQKAMKERELANRSIFAHEWHMPGWDYIQPLEDARADALKIEKLLESRERVAGERGIEFEPEAKRIISNNELLIALAIESRNRIRARFGEPIDWREILYLGSPDDMSAQAEVERAEAQKERERRVSDQGDSE